MEGHVRDIANVLKAEGKQAEVFADIDQAGKIFNIEGKNYKWDEIVDDFKNLNGKYKTNEKGWIIESELSSTLMYKANNQWAEKLVVEGYTVLDFSFPVNIYSESIFYDMELSIIFK